MEQGCRHLCTVSGSTEPLCKLLQLLPANSSSAMCASNRPNVHARTHAHARPLHVPRAAAAPRCRSYWPDRGGHVLVFTRLQISGGIPFPVLKRTRSAPASAARRGEDTRTPDTNTVLCQCTVGSSPEPWGPISPPPASTLVGLTFLFPARRRNSTAAHGVRHTLFTSCLRVLAVTNPVPPCWCRIPWMIPSVWVQKNVFN